MQYQPAQLYMAAPILAIGSRAEGLCAMSLSLDSPLMSELGA